MYFSGIHPVSFRGNDPTTVLPPDADVRTLVREIVSGSRRVALTISDARLIRAFLEKPTFLLGELEKTTIKNATDAALVDHILTQKPSVLTDPGDIAALKQILETGSAEMNKDQRDWLQGLLNRSEFGQRR